MLARGSESRTICSRIPSVAGDAPRLLPGNNIGYFGSHEANLRSYQINGHGASCMAGQLTLGIEAGGTIKGCPSLSTHTWAGGNVRDASLAEAAAVSGVRTVAALHDDARFKGSGSVRANNLINPLDPTRGFSGVRGLDLLNANPNFKNTTNGTDAADPFRLGPDQAATADMGHNYTPEQRASNGGAMDLFPKFVGTAGPPPGSPATALTKGLVMGYYDGNTVSELWRLAQDYALNDNSWTSVFGPSTPGAINLISGQTNGFDKTNKDPSLMSPSHVTPDGNGGWTMIGDTEPEPANHQYDTHDFFDALKAGNFPAVVYLKAPAYQDGPMRERSAAQQRHGRVSEPLLGVDGKPALGRCGYGTRVPLLVASPFAKHNYIDHTLTDQSSILKFIEDNWLHGECIQPGRSFDTSPVRSRTCSRSPGVEATTDTSDLTV